MVEPTIPVGMTIAVVVMTVISWYGMVRNGLELLFQDLAARKQVEADIDDMYTDIKHQEKNLKTWQREWYICKYTPDEVLLQYWGEDARDTIKKKLVRIQDDLRKAKQALDKVSGLNKVLRKVTFIGRYKKPTRELIKNYAENMTTIEKECKEGWDGRQRSLISQFGHVSRRDIQVSYSLIQIAMQIKTDAEALRASCQNVERDIAVLLDLDLFRSSAPEVLFPNVERFTQILEAGHLKLELLLREADQQQEELTRVEVEKAPDGEIPESRDIDAFRAILGATTNNPHCHHFNFNSSRTFRMSKIQRTGELCSRLHQVFHEALVCDIGSTYDANTRQLADNEAVLGQVSNSRAAFEVAQVCLLFLRNSWIANICRCRLRFGPLPDSTEQQLYHFGLDMTTTTHQPPKWPNPHSNGNYVQGDLHHSWCARDIWHWNSLNKPIRHLGLLLVEFALGTAVFPTVDSTTDGAAKITYISVLNTDPNRWGWIHISLRDTLKMVKRSCNDSDRVAEAVKHCLTASFDLASSDCEWETNLKRFYYRVVKPCVLHRCRVSLLNLIRLMDLYEIRATSGAPLP